MYRLRCSVASVVIGAALLAVTACSSSGTARESEAGVEVDFVNANVGDVTFLDSPLGKAVKLVGCPVHKCSPSPGSPSGSGVGWTENRMLPHTYRLSLNGSRLNCPPATAPPAGSEGAYAVVYQITRTGHCVIAQHSPVN